MLLAVDTATRLLSLAVVNDYQVLAETSWITANQHSVELSPAIERILTQTNITPNTLTAIAVAQGPGSFTGVRIGIGLAKGLAMALNIPLIPVPTLDIIAAATPYFDGKLVAVIQAGRGRIIAGKYCWQDSAWQAEAEPEITSWEKLNASIKTCTLLNGEIGNVNLHDLITLAPVPQRLRRASFLAQLALQRDSNSDPTMVMPIYLKQPGE